MALVLGVMADSMRSSSISNVFNLGTNKTGFKPFSVNTTALLMTAVLAATMMIFTMTLVFF